jgi:putative nucleotidyltransferase with HDIG domain
MEECLNQGIPTIEQAKLLLLEAQKLNPGDWIEHSINVGRAAELIAKYCKELNPDIALVLGMLHDIGRRYGKTNMRHSIDGYNFCKEQGYDLVARICITHCFPYKNVDEICGKWDCSNEEYNFVKEYLDGVGFSEYDKLIQLCDVLAVSTGYCLMEKRMVDVVMRYGFSKFTLEKWKATFELQIYFEEKIGKSIYSILPNVIENTFGF